jgi:DNA modification methylase
VAIHIPSFGDGPMVKSGQRAKRLVGATQLSLAPRAMLEVSSRDYSSFRRDHDSVRIENVDVALGGPWSVSATAPPKDYKPEVTTVWSFPDRGSWATHSGTYRGNWSPYIPRNLLLRYTRPGDTVLDQMVGSGTTLVECKLLGRRGVGVDINPNAIMVARDRLNFQFNTLDGDMPPVDIRTFVGDARNLDLLQDSSIDLVATHPPYASIVSYGGAQLQGDLSNSHRIEEFVSQIASVARESLRVLKPGKHCAILMGDTRRHKHFVPIAVRVLQAFLEEGFVIREDITKVQWNMKSTRERWAGSKYDFLLLAHEHLFVFRKLAANESRSHYKESAIWPLSDSLGHYH